MFHLFLTLFLLISLNCFAQLRPNYTTRLLSTSGAGVGSVLLNEAAFLNPAPIAFYDTTTFYTQFDKTKLTNENNRSKDLNGRNTYLLLSDTSGDLKGALSYQDKEEFDTKQTLLTATGSGLLSGNTAIGFTYAYASHENTDDETDQFHLINSGITHIKSEDLSFGLVFNDITKQIKENAKFIAGFQYKIIDILTFIFDIETNYYLNADDYSGYRAAFQTQFFDDFFLRLGKFDDGFLEQNGYSAGLSWYGPRLSLEYAMKEAKQKENLGIFIKDDKIIDQSLSLSVRF